MKIMHLLASNKFSGAENVVCQIINLFSDDKDIEMVYCSVDGPIKDALEERNIKFVPLKKLSRKEVKKAIKEQKPDIVHAHDMRASFCASCVCGNISLISHVHNNAFDSRGLSLKSIAYIFAGIKARHIFWVSDSSYNGYAFHDFFKKKSSILYNIIDVENTYKKMMLDENNYDYDVVYLGRLTLQKNPLRLIDICKLLIERNGKIKIAIVGTGEMEEITKNKAKELNLLNNISFLGFMPNPLKILRDSKVMVMTSLWEGTPMCALEAMAVGVPIVSTPVDGLKDIIANDENGFLSNDNNQLANKIIEYITDEKIYNKLTKNQKQKSIEWNNTIRYKQAIEKIYREYKN